MIDKTFVEAAHESVDDTIEAIRHELFTFDDWMERYEYIIELGRSLPPFPPEWKTDDRLVPGCQSRVWLEPRREREALYFAGTSDAAIVSGLVAILLRVYSGRRPAQIIGTSPAFLKEWGLIGALSGSRGNGVAAMAERIQWLAASSQSTGKLV